MKKIIISFFALTLSFGVFAQRGCNNNTPGWGESLGTVSFASEKTWKIGDQTWSDAVQATSCNKTTFRGKSRKYNSDCRSNPDYPGDLFSWCAVARFKEVLCPDGWRVPTQQDFIDLDKAFGGTGVNRYSLDFIPFITENYIARWGGTYGGGCISDGMLWQQGLFANYWVHSARGGLLLRFGTNGYVNPQIRLRMCNGFTLRCVRNDSPVSTDS